MNQKSIRRDMVAVARQFVHAPAGHAFTEREGLAIRPFFSNIDRKVFFIHRMPESVRTALLSMYSRIKDPRGLRGHWVNNVLPSQLAQFMDECARLLLAVDHENTPETAKNDKRAKVIQKWLKDNRLTTLDAFIDYNRQSRLLFEAFLGTTKGYNFWRRLGNSERIRAFLAMWLDAYGHNSIARTGQIVLGVEDISILAAKSIEWGGPGSAYIELSTRYVDVSAKGQYPIELELALIDAALARAAARHRDAHMDRYRTLMGGKFDGAFPSFLRQRWAGIVPDADIASGVIGETCDVLGNLLPTTTLTSLGASVSGESFAGLIKHLLLDDTPEGDALAEIIVSEAGSVGVGHFARHLEISEWRRADWSYLIASPASTISLLTPAELAQQTLQTLLSRTKAYRGKSWNRIIDELAALHQSGRSPHDKLPAQFGHISATFGNTMTWRSWRDLQRQTLCIHHRSLVDPSLGFYRYPKPAPPELETAFKAAHDADFQVYYDMVQRDVPETMRQYLMAMGETISYQVAANLWQWEFCNWQRSKWGVNDEVRQHFLWFEHQLRVAYPWWNRISRADVTPHYVFARGAVPVVLP
jgi:hypothetical protein